MPVKNFAAMAVRIISALDIALFCYAAFTEVSADELIKLELKKTRLVASFVPVIVHGIPVAEITIALLLMFRITRLTGLYLSLTLILLFSIFITVILHFSYYTPCPCIGLLRTMSWKAQLVFNLCYAALIVTGIVIESNAQEKI